MWITFTWLTRLFYVNPAGTSKLKCIRLGGVTECSWPSGGITAEVDTLDTVCDRGSLTNQTITTTGSIKAGGGKVTLQSDGTIVADKNLTVKGSATVNNTMTVGGNLVANGNTWGTCFIKTPSPGLVEGLYDCGNGYYVAGIGIKGYGDEVNKLKCCKL